MRESLGRILVTLGVVLVLTGLALWGKVPLFRLPGDLRIERGSAVVYLPVTTSLLLSAVLTLLVRLLR